MNNILFKLFRKYITKGFPFHFFSRTVTVMAKMSLIFLILVQACVAYSFLLPNTTRLSSFEYQHLSQLVYNGESRTAVLEQELMTLKSVHDQAIADM